MNVRRPILSRSLDLLAILSFWLGIHIARTGGFIFWVGSVRTTFRTPGRAFALAVLIVAIRVALDRRTSLLAIRWRELGRKVWTALTTREDALSEAPSPGWWRRAAYATSGLLALHVIVLHKQWLDPFGLPDLGDPYFSIWRIGWIAHQMVNDPARLFDANIFYPAPLTLTYSDSVLLPGLMAAPLIWSGVHPVLAYQFLFLIAFVGSGLTLYVLMERLTGSPLAAFVSAAMFTFFPYRLQHYVHLELQMTQWMPICLLALHQLLRTGRRRYLLVMAAALVAQLYSAMYYTVFFVMYLAALALVLLPESRVRIRRLVIPAAAAATLALLLALPLILPYAASSVFLGERDVRINNFFSAQTRDYLIPSTRSAVWGGQLLEWDIATQTERALFPGAVPLVLAGSGLLPPLGSVRLAYAAGLLLAFDSSLGFNGLFYPHLYEWFPPVRQLRVPARFSILVALSLAVLAGFGARYWFSRAGSPANRRVVFAMMMAALVIDVWPRLNLVPSWREPPSIYAHLRGRSDAVLAEFPFTRFPEDDIKYQYLSIWHFTRMPNGYSGNIPDSYYQYADEIAGFPDRRSIAALSSRGVTHVSFYCIYSRLPCARALRQIDETGALRVVAEDEWAGEPVRLYELRR